MIKASNRQLKLLKFFGVPATSAWSQGAAGWEIAKIMKLQGNEELWRRYIFITGDVTGESADPVPVDPVSLWRVDVPSDFDYRAAVRRHRKEVAADTLKEDSRAAVRRYHEEVAAEILEENSPFDIPQPPVTFEGCTFMFTGKFDYGTREQCEQMVVSLGGKAAGSKSVSSNLDFLVIGNQGNAGWRQGSYGNKIEAAVVKRRDTGMPAIISEDHFVSALKER
ncbi:MAG: BRCT domain-containing protein [Betaproteobacteria bacterium]|nr:BRCT domain-containing protein [Betaproteobacteria bacterium]